MKRVSILFSFMIISLFANTSLYAGIPIIHGHFQDIHKIVDVKLKGSNGDKLFLGYMTESYYIEAGVYIKDEGYILGVEGKEGSFYPMPTGNDLKSFQKNGFLPNPLPQYNIPIKDYIIGYSLWIILFLVIAYYIGTFVTKQKLKQTQKTQEEE